jgi:hypothetical protein
MTSFIFNYNNFYNYYTNPNNLFTDSRNNKPILNHYRLEYITGQTPIPTQCPNQFITIGVGIRGSGGVGVYIQILPNRKLLFTIPTEINGQYWDYHYHFGRASFYNKGNLIFFHKTIQDPNANTKSVSRCYFHDNLTIQNVEDIICEQETIRKMSQKFPFHHLRDIEIIKEIISRPFLGIVNLGGSKNKIYYGKKGGKYIVKSGKKIYISKKLKNK